MKLFVTFAALLLVGAAPWLSGCQRTDEAMAGGLTVATVSRDTSPPPRATRRPALVQVDAPNSGGLFYDSETGCQYFSSWGHGLTPRMVWDEKRQEMMQMGCYIKETVDVRNP